VPPAPTPQDLDPASDIGVRTFDEISATLSKLTGVSQNNQGVLDTMAEVRQAMPAIPSAEAYASSHQAAIGQLAVEYCHALMNDTALRGSTFPGFNFNTDPVTAFGNRSALFNPLLDRVLGVTQLAHQPDRAAVIAELDMVLDGRVSVPPRPGLLNDLPAGESNNAARTPKVAAAICAAVVGSAAMLVQ
jgi:hypothetical protein